MNFTYVYRCTLAYRRIGTYKYILSARPELFATVFRFGFVYRDDRDGIQVFFVCCHLLPRVRKELYMFMTSAVSVFECSTKHTFLTEITHHTLMASYISSSITLYRLCVCVCVCVLRLCWSVHLCNDVHHIYVQPVMFMAAYLSGALCACVICHGIQLGGRFRNNKMDCMFD